MLTYLAAILPAEPTGFWNRHPNPTPRGKAEKYPLRDGSLHGYRAKCCSMRLFMAALP